MAKAQGRSGLRASRYWGAVGYEKRSRTLGWSAPFPHHRAQDGGGEEGEYKASIAHRHYYPTVGCARDTHKNDRPDSLRLSGIFSFAPRGAWFHSGSYPMPYGVGCILSPLRGCFQLRRVAAGSVASRFLLPLLPETSGVITPTAGARSRAIRGCCSAPWLSDVPVCPSLTWGGCGGREFPRTCASLHPGPTFARLRELKSSIKVVRHNCEINVCGKL